MIQLVAYASQQDGGGRLGILPAVRSFTATMPFNEVGAMQFTYPKQGARVEFITQASPTVDKYFEVGVEIAPTNGAFTEPTNARYIYMGRNDEGTESSGDLSFELVGYAWPLKKARVFGLNSLDEEGKRVFNNASAGQIIRTLLDENKALGWHPGLTYTFTSAVDSAGQAWTSNLPKISYAPTQDIFTILNNLAEQGLCDWTMNGRELQLFKPDIGLAADLTSTVVLRYGVGLKDGPNKLDASNLVHKVLVQGEGGNRLIIDQTAGTAAPWGKWIDAIDQGGISDTATMSLFADKSLQSGETQTKQLTRTLSMAAANDIYPGLHYQAGDYITAPGVTGQLEKLRVREIGLSQSDTGVFTAILTLNDRIQEASIRLARRTVGIVGGSTATGGSGATPGYEDKRTPKAPTGLTLTSDAYLDPTGNPHGFVQVNWAAVTQATDNTSIQINEYEVWIREDLAGEVYRRQTTTGVGTQVVLDGFDPGTNWLFKMRSHAANGEYSAFSAEVAILIKKDIIPPDQPSTPVVTSEFGTLKITWDGLTQGGGAQPRDYTGTTVYVSATSNFTPSAANAVDTLTGPGITRVGGIPYGEGRFVKLVSTDNSGNRSLASTQVAGTVTAFLGAEQIGGLNITPGSIDYTRLSGGGLGGNLITDPNYTDAQLNTIRKNGAVANPANVTITPASATFPIGFVTIVGPNTFWHRNTASETSPTPVVPGRKYLFSLTVERTSGTGTLTVGAPSRQADGSGLGTTLASGVNPSGPVDLSYVWTAPVGAVSVTLAVIAAASSTWKISKPSIILQTPGSQIEDNAIAAANLANNAVTAVSIADNAITAGKISANAVIAGKIAANAVTAGTIATNAVTADKILAGAIIAEKIAANAISADKIAANTITAGQIAAGSITALTLSATAIDGKTITGATIRTSAAYPMLAMSTAGIQQLSSAGVALSIWTPNGFQFRSGTSGSRTEFDYNGMRLYRADGIMTVNFNAANGDGLVTGIFRTKPPGNSTLNWPRIEVDDALWSPENMTGMRFYTAYGFAQQAEIKSQYGGGGIIAGGSVIISSSEAVNSPQENATGRGEIELVTGQGVRMGFRRGGIWTNTYVDAKGNDVNISSQGGQFVTKTGTGFLGATGGWNIGYWDAASGFLSQLRIGAGNGAWIDCWSNLRLKNYPTTTAGAAISGIDSDGMVIARGASLSRYKLEQQPVGLHYEVLDLEPKTWFDKYESDNGTAMRRYAGLVAENVREVSNANSGGLNPLLQFRDDVLQGVAYDRIPAYLIPVIKDMADRISHLESLLEGEQ